MVDSALDFNGECWLRELVEFAAQTEAHLSRGTWLMSLRLSTDATISELHEQFFSDPSATDVITFPSGDPLDDDGAYLGDVIVSVDTATFQAAGAGHARDREIAFLALHGLLHLCGHDDRTAEQRAGMHARQYQLLDAWERAHDRPW